MLFDCLGWGMGLWFRICSLVYLLVWYFGWFVRLMRYYGCLWLYTRFGVLNMWIFVV